VSETVEGAESQKQCCNSQEKNTSAVSAEEKQHCPAINDFPAP